MAVYLVNIALILFWRVFLTQKHIAAPRKLYCSIVMLQWTLISGLRHWTVGADTDTYLLMFERVKEIPWANLIDNLLGYLFRGEDANDPGYFFLTKVFQIFSQDYQVFLLAIAAFFMSMMGVWIYRYSSAPCTSFVLFSTLFYAFYAITGHRQTIATALVVFWGYELIRKRSLWKFLAVCFVAYLIHKSSLVFLPFYFLTMIPVTTTYMAVCLAGIAVVAVLGKRLYGPIAIWLGYDEHQVEYAKGGAETYAVLLIALCIVTLLLFRQIKKNREDADYLFHATSVTLLAALLVIQNQVFMRIQQYYSLFIMITVPEVINVVKREYRLLVYLGFCAVMVLYIILQNPQYSFFWS